MFFILSKTISFLAMPLVVVCVLFVLSALLRNTQWKKRLFFTGLVALFFFSNDFVANEVMRWWEIPPTRFEAISTTYNYGIVLTGVTKNDFEPADRVYFARGADRVVHTVELYKRGIIRKVLISGGMGRLLTEGRREADDLYRAMVLMGVEPGAIIIENESRNTYESAVNVKAQLNPGEAEPCLLITSAFHMRRSAACFKKAGLEADVFSTDFYAHPRYFTPDVLLVPSVDALVIWHKLVKEWMGMVAYWVAGYI
jgi:uncharacterized SAM-binding protein YcdF (DUF218 family)